MTLPIPLPYGIRDVKLTPYTTDAATTLGTPSVDLPNSRTLSFAETEDFEELRGDDGVVTVRGKGAGVDWELEGGGISLEATKTMYGGVITETGTTPARKKQLRKKATDTRPFFKAEGQAISDSGGDFHVVLHLCRSTGDLSGEMAEGSFFLTGGSGRALGSKVAADLGVVYDFIQNETAVAIP